jgi:hypothetical protein
MSKKSQLGEEGAEDLGRMEEEAHAKEIQGL